MYKVKKLLKVFTKSVHVVQVFKYLRFLRSLDHFLVLYKTLRRTILTNMSIN